MKKTTILDSIDVLLPEINTLHSAFVKLEAQDKSMQLSKIISSELTLLILSTYL
jgi:hypothetical protein